MKFFNSVTFIILFLLSAISHAETKEKVTGIGIGIEKAGQIFWVKDAFYRILQHSRAILKREI